MQRSRRTGTLRPAELADLVRDLAEAPHIWSPQVRFDPTRRWWGQLYADARLEVWQLTWQHDTSTDLHDHGDSAAAFTVVSGILTESTPRRGGRLRQRVLPAGTTRAMGRGAVHDVGNHLAEPAVSIHAYSPPLEHMTYYDLQPQGLSTLRTVESSEPEAVAS